MGRKTHTKKGATLHLKRARKSNVHRAPPLAAGAPLASQSDEEQVSGIHFPSTCGISPRLRHFLRLSFAPAGRAARNTARRSSRCSVIRRGGGRRRGERGEEARGREGEREGDRGSLSSAHPRLPTLPGQLKEKGSGRPHLSFLLLLLLRALRPTASRCLLPSQLERSLAHARPNEMSSGSERGSQSFEHSAPVRPIAVSVHEHQLKGLINR